MLIIMGSTRTNMTSLKHDIILLIISKKNLQDNLTIVLHTFNRVTDGWLLIDYY